MRDERSNCATSITPDASAIRRHALTISWCQTQPRNPDGPKRFLVRLIARQTPQRCAAPVGLHRAVGARLAEFAWPVTHLRQGPPRLRSLALPQFLEPQPSMV